MKFSTGCLIAAPVFFAAYGVVRLIGRMDGQYGPGLDWQAAHVLYLVGLLLLIPGLLAIRRMLPRTGMRAAALVLSFIGVATGVVQFVVDIVVGLMAEDKAGMRELSGEFSSIPGVPLVFYTVGPQLLYLGLFLLTIMLVRVGTLRWWSPALVFVGSGFPGLSLDLIPLGALCLLVAVAPLTRAVTRPAVAAPVPAR